MKEGDIVKLKSGGYKMTIDRIGTVATACVWHDKNGILHNKLVPIHALELWVVE